jgi:hypothetical protein
MRALFTPALLATVLPLLPASQGNTAAPHRHLAFGIGTSIVLYRFYSSWQPCRCRALAIP